MSDNLLSYYSTPTKKSLRRKPPPDVVSTDQNDPYLSTDGINTHRPPPLPPRFSHDGNQLSQYPQAQYQSPHQSYHQQSPWNSFGMGNDNGNDFTNVSFTPQPDQNILTEEEIVNMSTPKPRGPKQLPEYDFGVMDTQVHGHDYAAQEDLNSIKENLTPPYPLQDPLQDPLDDYGNPTITNKRTPFSPEKKAEILDQSLRTPTKIPSLEASNSFNSIGNGYDSNNSRIPLHRDNYMSSTIPMNSQSYPIPDRRQRSQSPKKMYGRSPSLMYDRPEDSFYYDDTNDLEPDDDVDVEDQQMDYSYMSHERQDVFDDELDSESESPTSKLFDYSILPDLPSATTGTSNPPSPSKRMTLNSAISFVKENGYFDDTNQITSKQSIRRKNDELPPVPLDLPKLPFASSSLVSRHFAECPNVWSLRTIFEWCLKIKTWLHELFILKKEFKKALIKLLVFHRRDISLDTIGNNVDQIIRSLLKAQALSFDYGTVPGEDGEKALPDPGKDNDATTRGTKANPGVILHEHTPVSGVLVDLTDCYCYDKHHEYELKANDMKLRCLSSRCYLNRVIDYELKFRQTNINEIILGEDWATHWKLSADDIKSFDKELAKKQSLLFDLLKYEQTFIQRASCFVELVGPEFIKTVKLLLSSNEIVLINKFDNDVLNPGKELLQIHKKSLMEPLLRILISNGKFIKDVTDIANIYQNWSQVAKPALLKYMSTVPMIEELINLPSIKQWVDVSVRNFKSVQTLRVNGPLLFLSTFNSRYQQLPLQLSDIMKQYDEQDLEYVSLSKAIDGIKKTSSKVNEMKLHADNIHALKRIQSQLHWKRNTPTANINFTSENRKFFYRGDLTRKGDLKINSSIHHVILLDNYLLICERFKVGKNKFPHYRVVERPIPVEFLLVEIKERETPTIELNNITKTLTQLPQQGSPKHELIVDQEDQSVYPFKIRYGGYGKNNAFVFSTKNERERNLWIEHLMRARSNLCLRLSKVEPYGLKLISNTCFAYEESNKISKLQSITQHDPLEKMSMDSLTVLQKFDYKGDIYSLANTSGHIVYSTTQCANQFIYNNCQYYFIGTSTGVYCCDMIQQWKRVILITGTSMISVLPSINLVIILSGNSLNYYPLDVLINYYYGKRESITGITLTNEPVSLFKIGKHREITMIFYATKKGNSSGATNFKVCVPELDNNGIFSSFKVVKRFYVQADCYGLSIFNSTFAVHTNKGIEVLELDKLLPRSIPELPYTDNKRIDGYNRKVIGGPNSNEIEIIRRSIYATNSKPMGMFKLNNNSEFLLAYNECAIFVNKHGKLSRFTILRFDYKAKSIAFKNNHLFIACEEALEVWSISDFVKGTNKLIQVLVGKDIRMLCNDDKIICSIANPVVSGLQLLFELQSNRNV